MAEKESLYLQHLKFDERLNGSFIARYYSNTRLIILIILCLVVGGAIAFARLPRQLNPDVDIPIVSVSTTLPGAAPADVENLITEKIEKELTSIPNVDVIISSSNESFSIITVQFLGNVETDKAVDDVKQRVDLVRDLPEDASDPVVQKLDFNDAPIWMLSITGEMDRLSLSKVATDLKDKLEDLSSIRNVTVQGAEEEEIVVELNSRALQELNIASGQITQALRSNDLSFPAGRIIVSETEYTLTIDNELQSVSQLRNLPVSVGGKFLPLGEIADIYLRTKENNSQTYYRQHGKRVPSVQLSVYKSEGSSIDKSYDDAKQLINNEIKQYPSIAQHDIFNSAEETTKSFDNLQGNFVQSVILVLIALTLFLGARQAVIAAISLPLTIMCTFLFMGVTGISLNFLAIFSLLLAISLIGDDAIVIVQSSKQYQKHFPPFEAGLMVFKDFFIPIWTGTLTVVWSFVPLLLASGIIGKFIRPIPIVVSATLLSSTAIATLINLPLNIVLAQLNLPGRLRVLLTLIGAVLSMVLVFSVLNGSPFVFAALALYALSMVLIFLNRNSIVEQFKKTGNVTLNKNSRVKSFFNWVSEKELLSKPLFDVSPLANRYQSAIEKVIRKKKLRFTVYGTIIGLIVLSIVLLATGLLKTEFFPNSDAETMYVNIEGPAGWSQSQIEPIVQQVESRLDQLTELKEMSTSYGSLSSGDFSGGTSGHNLANITMTLKPDDERTKGSVALAEELRKEFAQINEAKVTVQELSGGPPAGADVQINIKGDDLEELEKISNDFQNILKGLPGTVNVQSSLKLSPGQIHVDLIPAELAERGLSAAQVGDWLRTAITGLETGDIVINNEDIDITLTLQDSQQNLSKLQNLQLPSQLGQYTLSEVAEFRLEQSPSSIAREDGKRVVRVTAGASQGMPGTEIFKQFQEKVKGYEMPTGYSWDVGGENEENQKSVMSILQAMGVSFFLILITMVLLLGSFRQAFMVLAVIPLATSGVFINFTLFGIPLSFPALIGVLALFGIVVNNALMLMDKINQNVHEGFPLYKGVADACASRIEPIFLSSLTGILGLLPITIADPFWRGLGGAIIAGLSFSGLLVLFFIPSIYVEILGHEMAKKHAKKA